MSQGYGLDKYGLDFYGGSLSFDYEVQTLFPNATDIIFSQPVNLTDSVSSASSYRVLTIRGCDLIITSTSVLSSTRARLYHNVATTGGLYEITILGSITSQSNGLPINPYAKQFLTKGKSTSFSVDAIDGYTLRLLFDDAIEPSLEVLNLNNYEITTSYFIPISLDKSEQVSANEIKLSVSSMAVEPYDILVNPADAILYESTVLPSVIGSIENGTGVSSIVGGNRLNISKSIGDVYGWEFNDSSGRVTNQANYRLDCDFDFSSSIITPDIFGIVWSLVVSDGTTQITVNFLNDDRIQIESGANSKSLDMSWKQNNHKISLLRNQRIDSYVLLLDENPIVNLPISFGIEFSSIPEGFSIDFAAIFDLTNARFGNISLTASETIFTSSLNFLHSLGNSFIGLLSGFKDTLYTEHGPLVKSWGDATPATINDVEVRINGVPVPLLLVNPYIGQIRLLNPIPSGVYNVEVDYFWMKNPFMAFSGLNTEGLVLNQWGFNSPRFPLKSSLHYARRDQPKKKEFRYMALEARQTASLNRPQSLLLNQNPKTERNKPLEYRFIERGDFYPAEEDPFKQWFQEGMDNGNVENGFWKMNPQGEVTYSRDLIVDSRSTYRMNVRFPQGSDSCFFGFHNGLRKTYCKFSLVNGLRHILVEREDGNFEVGGGLSCELVSQNQFLVEKNRFLEIGTKFQILDGSQIGVYTIGSIEETEDGENFLIAILESFPFDVDLWGNKFVIGYPEISFDQTFILEADFQQNLLYVESEEGLLFNGFSISSLARVEETIKNGRVFWGSSQESTWDFIDYTVSPAIDKEVGFNSIASTEMDSLPYEDENSPWKYEQKTGIETLQGGELRVSKFLEKGHAYKRREFLFLDKAEFDLDSSLKVFDFVGSHNVVNVRTPNKEITLATLLYRENTPQRELLDVPFTSADIGIWDSYGNLNSSTEKKTVQENGKVGGFRSEIDLSEISFADPDYNRVLLAQLEIQEIPSAIETGVFLEFETAEKKLAITFENDSPRRILLGEMVSETSFNPIQSYVFDWSGLHTYRIVCSSNIVSLFVDEVLQAPTLGSGSFSIGGANKSVRFGHYTTTTNAIVNWNFVHYQVETPSFAKKTFGVFLGGDQKQIDNWEIPRTDSLFVPNSDLSAVVQEMDWEQFCNFRLHYDKNWGVTFYRPDLPNPPYFNTQFSSEITNPSQGWINVEMQKIPDYFEGLETQATGLVRFGSLTKQPIDIFWDYLRYRIYRRTRQENLSSRFMILNKASQVVHPFTDREYEVFTIDVKNPLEISLRDFDLYAKTIVVIADGQNYLTPNVNFTFNFSEQKIKFPQNNPLQNPTVTITFKTGKKHTKTTILKQDTDLCLFDGNPIFEMAETQKVNISTISGSILTDERGFPELPADFIDNTPYSYKQYDVEENQKLECLDLFVSEKWTERISPFCECFLGLDFIDTLTNIVVYTFKP